MSPAPQGRNHCLSEAILERYFYPKQFCRKAISGVVSAMETISHRWKPPQRCATALGPSTCCWCCWSSLPSLLLSHLLAASLQSCLSFCPAPVWGGVGVLVWVINPPSLSCPSRYWSSQGNGGWDGKFKGAQPKILQLNPLPCYCYHCSVSGPGVAYLWGSVHVLGS